MIPPDRAVELSHPIRYGATRALLLGVLLTDTGEQATVCFDITLDVAPTDEHRAAYKVVVQFDGPVPEPPPDVIRIGEGRSFHEEFLQPSSAVWQNKSVTVSSPGDAAEQEADQVASAALAHQLVGPIREHATGLTRHPRQSDLGAGLSSRSRAVTRGHRGGCSKRSGMQHHQDYAIEAYVHCARQYDRPAQPIL